jgi:hypothetical protein
MTSQLGSPSLAHDVVSSFERVAGSKSAQWGMLHSIIQEAGVVERTEVSVKNEPTVIRYKMSDGSCFYRRAGEPVIYLGHER